MCFKYVLQAVMVTKISCSGRSTSRSRTQRLHHQTALLLLRQHKNGSTPSRVLEKWLFHRVRRIHIPVTKHAKDSKQAPRKTQVVYVSTTIVVRTCPAATCYKSTWQIVTGTLLLAGNDSASGNPRMAWRPSSESSDNMAITSLSLVFFRHGHLRQLSVYHVRRLQYCHHW